MPTAKVLIVNNPQEMTDNGNARPSGSGTVRLRLVHEIKIFDVTSDISEMSEGVFGY